LTALHLRRIDDARNVRRFYQLDVQPDLFGGALLVKEWGRIGSRGRIVDESYREALATDAMQKHADRKRRRGYYRARAHLLQCQCGNDFPD
jgi:predicted DNA-binding WGR domain protein